MHDNKIEICYNIINNDIFTMEEQLFILNDHIDNNLETKTDTLQRLCIMKIVQEYNLLNIEDIKVDEFINDILLIRIKSIYNKFHFLLYKYDLIKNYIIKLNTSNKIDKNLIYNNLVKNYMNDTTRTITKIDLLINTMPPLNITNLLKNRINNIIEEIYILDSIKN